MFWSLLSYRERMCGICTCLYGYAYVYASMCGGQSWCWVELTSLSGLAASELCESMCLPSLTLGFQMCASSVHGWWWTELKSLHSYSLSLLFCLRTHVYYCQYEIWKYWYSVEWISAVMLMMPFSFFLSVINVSEWLWFCECEIHL